MEPKSLIQIISEEEFLPIIEKPSAGFFKLFNLFVSILEKEREITRNFYSNIMQEAEFLESFLDEHGARENKRWLFFVEYVASIRNLGIAAFYLKHLVDRYPYYNLPESEDTDARFLNRAHETLDFINRSIHNLYREILVTGKANGMEIPIELSVLKEFGEIETNKRLPRNISEDEIKNEEERIIEVCEKIQKASKMMADAKIEPKDDIKDLKKIIPHKLDEKRARMFMNVIHNVQSEYDTYVKNTRLEQDNEDLKKIRGYISIPLHLLEFVLWLCHFYERHEDEIRHGECKQKITLLVDKNELLDKIANFGFFYARHFIQEGKNLADEVLKHFVKVVRVELPIPDPLGFHARPSTYITLIAREHDGDVFMIVDGEKYNAKSVMSLLQAAGTVSDKGYKTVTFEGDKRVIDDLKILAKHNYCEDKKIPRRLSYLRELKSTA